MKLPWLSKIFSYPMEMWQKIFITHENVAKYYGIPLWFTPLRYLALKMPRPLIWIRSFIHMQLGSSQRSVITILQIVVTCHSYPYEQCSQINRGEIYKGSVHPFTPLSELFWILPSNFKMQTFWYVSETMWHVREYFQTCFLTLNNVFAAKTLTTSP